MIARRVVVVITLALAALPARAVEPPALPPLVRLTHVASLQRPVGMAVRAGSEALYFVEKGGRVRALDGETLTTVLDLSSEVSTGGEQGLLGLAFAPDGATLVVNFTDVDGDTRIQSFPMLGEQADVSGRREILFIDQPRVNHNGGALMFGPDDNLWIATGDGGISSNAQRLDTLLGKVLRITLRPDEDPPYAVPPDNPFVGVEGARAEIWSYGLRNPWRFTFDRLTGDVWIGDVGLNSWEEVDHRPATSSGAENYGWDLMEGNQPHRGTAPPDHVPPIHEYAHAGGNCSVTGGYRYRGTRNPALAGVYVFTDWCAGDLRGLVVLAGVAIPVPLGVSVVQPTSFGEDADGELYVMSSRGDVWRLDPA